MLKVIGLIMVVLVCAGIGIYMAATLGTRQKRLYSICLFIEEIADRMRAGRELGEIIRTSGQKAGISISGMNPEIKGEGLTQQDIKIVEEFFEGLGMGDTESQLKRCEVYLQLVRKQETAARVAASEKSGLYRKLGIFTGLFIAVILI